MVVRALANAAIITVEMEPMHQSGTRVRWHLVNASSCRKQAVQGSFKTHPVPEAEEKHDQQLGRSRGRFVHEQWHLDNPVSKPRLQGIKLRPLQPEIRAGIPNSSPIFSWPRTILKAVRHGSLRQQSMKLVW